jgi:hypothetical protein
MKYARKLSLAVAALVVGTSVPAFAAPVTSSAHLPVVQTEYNNNASPGPVLLIQLTDGVNYSATLGVAPCTGVGGVVAPTSDTLKIWASLAQGALLSGKNVTIYWSDCSMTGARFITDVVLVR